MKAIRDLAGQRFGRLVAIRVDGKDAQGRMRWSCQCDCGVVKTIASRHLVQENQSTCGCKLGLLLPKPMLGRKKDQHPRWQGGIQLRDGYVWLYKDGGQYEYEAEHRLVAEQLLGRPLEPHEVVHHKNGVRHDNRPENIEVLTRVEHAREHGLGTNIRVGGAK